MATTEEPEAGPSSSKSPCKRSSRSKAKKSETLSFYTVDCDDMDLSNDEYNPEENYSLNMQLNESEDSEAPLMESQDSPDYDQPDPLMSMAAELEEEQQNSNDEEEEDVVVEEEDVVVEEEDNTESNQFSNIKVPTLLQDSHLKNPKRQNYCVYCGKMQTHISRHLLRRHKKETSIIEVMNEKPGSKHRRKLLEKLRKEGNINHNTKVITNKSGTLKTNRRSKNINKIDEFLPCVYCKAVFTKAAFMKHRRTCELVPKSNKNYKSGRYAASAASVALFSNTEISEEFKSEILYKMVNNDVHRIIIKDKLILKYGCKIYNENQGVVCINDCVKKYLRDLGKIISEVQKIDSSIILFEQLFNVKYWDILVSAILKINAPDNKIALSTSSRNIIKIGEHINKMCDMVLEDSTYNYDKNSEVIKFLEYKSEHWDTIIETITEKLKENKFNNSDLLILVEDIKNITENIKNRIEDIVNKIKNNDGTLELWLQLAKLIQCRIIMFNRKNIKEISSLKLEEYEKKIEPSPISKNSIKADQFFSSIMTKVKKIGKKSQIVPLLLTKDMIEALDILIETRNSLGNVAPENKYVFANPKTKSSFQGNNSFKEITETIKIKSDDFLLKCRILKHLASYIGQIIGLGPYEFEKFTQFLTSTLKLYSNYYKLQENIISIAKLSLILQSLDQGSKNIYAHKKLDKIDFESIPTSLDEADSEEEVIGYEVKDHDVSSGVIGHGVSSGVKGHEMNSGVAGRAINLKVKGYGVSSGVKVQEANSGAIDEDVLTKVILQNQGQKVKSENMDHDDLIPGVIDHDFLQKVLIQNVSDLTVPQDIFEPDFDSSMDINSLLDEDSS